jgi:hypothetical protein
MDQAFPFLRPPEDQQSPTALPATLYYDSRETVTSSSVLQYRSRERHASRCDAIPNAAGDELVRMLFDLDRNDESTRNELELAVRR